MWSGIRRGAALRRYLSVLAWVLFAGPAFFHYGGWAKVVVAAVTAVVLWGAVRDWRARSRP